MKAFIILLTVLSAGSWVAAETPTTKPAGPTVLIAPFAQINGSAENGSHAWVAKALQEDMVSTVSRYGYAQPKALDKPMANTDFSQAIKEGRANNAAIVVYGSYQVLSDQIRINGSVTNVGTGNVMGSLQSTGPVQDLFKIEDVLSNQLRAVMSQSSEGALPMVAYGPRQGSANPFYCGEQGAATQDAAAQGALPYATDTTQPDTGIPGYSYNYITSSTPVYVQTPSYSSAPYNYGYDYGYPYNGYPYAYNYGYGYGGYRDYVYGGYPYGYSYPYVYGPSFFVGGFFGGGFRGRDFDGGRRGFDRDGDRDFGRFRNGGGVGIVRGNGAGFPRNGIVNFNPRLGGAGTGINNGRFVGGNNFNNGAVRSAGGGRIIGGAARIDAAGNGGGQVIAGGTRSVGGGIGMGGGRR